MQRWSQPRSECAGDRIEFRGTIRTDDVVAEYTSPVVNVVHEEARLHAEPSHPLEVLRRRQRAVLDAVTVVVGIRLVTERSLIGAHDHVDGCIAAAWVMTCHPASCSALISAMHCSMSMFASPRLSG